MSYKGAQNCLTGAVKVRAQTFAAIKLPASATALNDTYNKFLAKCNFLHCAAHQLTLADEQTHRPGKRPRLSFIPCRNRSIGSTGMPKYKLEWKHSLMRPAALPQGPQGYM